MPAARSARLLVAAGALGLGGLLAGCGGTSDYERCVQHFLEEGVVDRATAEQGCREANPDD